MKEKANKTHDYKVRESDPENGICNCIIERKISKQCLKTGICPSFSSKIVLVVEGYKVGKRNVRKEKEVIRKINWA